MRDEGLKGAIARLESAVDRVERALAKHPHTGDIEARHARLKASVARAIETLDTLIEAR